MQPHLGDKTGELGIIAYFESDNYWNLITTRGVVIAEGQNISRVNLDDINHYDVGDFKGIITKKKTETMVFKDKDKVIAEMRYETGKPSMGAIYGIRTLMQIGKGDGYGEPRNQALPHFW